MHIQSTNDTAIEWIWKMREQIYIHSRHSHHSRHSPHIGYIVFYTEITIRIAEKIKFETWCDIDKCHSRHSMERLIAIKM